MMSLTEAPLVATLAWHVKARRLVNVRVHRWRHKNSVLFRDSDEKTTEMESLSYSMLPPVVFSPALSFTNRFPKSHFNGCLFVSKRRKFMLHWALCTNPNNVVNVLINDIKVQEFNCGITTFKKWNLPYVDRIWNLHSCIFPPFCCKCVRVFFLFPLWSVTYQP